MNENEMIEEGVDVKIETGTEYLRQLDELKNLEMGSKEYAEAVKGAAALGKLTLELEQQQIDYELEMIKQEREAQRIEMEKKKADEESKRADKKQKAETITEGAKVFGGIAIPLVSLGVFSKNLIKVLKFEEMGSVTSAVGKSLISKIIPRL